MDTLLFGRHLGAFYALSQCTAIYLQIDDFLYIHRLAHTSKSIAVIGGGFLGSELACALGYKGQS